MARIQYSTVLGIHCGLPCGYLAVLLASLYLAGCMAFTLTARLHVKAWYHASHMAGLSAFIAAFVLSHHLIHLNRCLACGEKAFSKVQCLLNTWSMVLSLVAAIGYTLLTAATVNLNFDYLGALLFGWVDFLFMLYLLVISVRASKGDWYSSYDVGAKSWKYYDNKGMEHELKSMPSNDDNGHINANTDSYNMAGPSSSSARARRGCCASCCQKCGAVILGFFYVLFHIIFAVVIFLTAYHPCTVAIDMYKYRDPADLYTVHVRGHRPLALYLRCRGNGSETVVYENGLGGLAMMEWSFIPKYLENKYRVCVYDRRGYGWSEGYESDDVTDKPQEALNSMVFLRELVNVSKIAAPFYYVGHSYGGLHVTYLALIYPELVKGAVYLDSSKFSAVKSLRSYLEMLVNFQPLGLLRIAIDTKLLDYKSVFSKQINLNDVTPEVEMDIVASVRSGYYLASFMREEAVLRSSRTTSDGMELSVPAADLQELLLRATKIDTPIFVIDAGDREPWFANRSSTFFSKWREDGAFLARVGGSDHQSLVYSPRYSNTTAELIDYFIRYTSGNISLPDFVAHKDKISGRSSNADSSR